MVAKAKKWVPMNEIQVHGEPYVYVGDTQNTMKAKEHHTNFSTDQGRRITYVVDKNDKKVLCMYVSKKFYPEMCKTIYPAYGKETLVRSK